MEGTSMERERVEGKIGNKAMFCLLTLWRNCSGKIKKSLEGRLWREMRRVANE